MLFDDSSLIKGLNAYVSVVYYGSWFCWSGIHTWGHQKTKENILKLEKKNYGHEPSLIYTLVYLIEL